MRHERDAILARVDLEALADELLGPRPRPFIRMWPCPNPDHPQTGKTPPLSVFPGRNGRQRWHCHGCGEGGTAIDLLLATRHAVDVRDALDWLAHRVGLEPQPPPGGHRAVVQHHLSESERHLVDTDQRMRRNPRGFTGGDQATGEGVVVDAA